MKQNNKLILITLGLTGSIWFSACQGRTTDTVEPDGSAPQEVKIPEEKSATETRDSLRKIVGEAASAVDSLSNK